MTEWQYTLCEPNLDEAEQEAALACLKSGWLSMGAKTREFEEQFAKMHNVEHAFAVSNGTAALHLAMLCLDIDKVENAEIIQPSLNFVAGANMTRAVGSKPVFADILDLTEPTIDPDDVARRIGPNTVAVMAMHYGGYPARIQELRKLCKENELFLIEDACHAPAQPVAGAGGQCLGTFGDVGCFSFFSNKNMTCGEGGMVVTNNDDLAERLRTLRSHGMTSLTWERHNKRLGSYDVLESGYNYRTDDLRSSIALAQLSKLEDAQAKRRKLAQAYVEAADKYEEIRYVFAPAVKEGTAHIATILVDSDIRDLVREGLVNAGIQTSLHYPPVHQFSAFEQDYEELLPKTLAFASQVITLPMYPGLPETAPGEIIAECHSIIENIKGGSQPVSMR